jgi:hypothetical protein
VDAESRMSFSLSAARATIKKVAIDKEAADDGSKTTTAALKVELKTSADILAEFHPSLRAAWFVRDGGIRFPAMKEVGWTGTRRGVDLAVRPGPDMKPAITLQDVVMRDFKLKPIEESGQQMVFIQFYVDLSRNGAPPIARLAEYLKEESWIDIQGGGELDLAPPSARTEIAGIDDTAPPPPPAAAPPRSESRDAPPDLAGARAVITDAVISQVRRLQPTTKGVKAKLANYPNEVLSAAIAAETAAANCRPMFISMIEAELERRAKEKP